MNQLNPNLILSILIVLIVSCVTSKIEAQSNEVNFRIDDKTLNDKNITTELAYELDQHAIRLMKHRSFYDDLPKGHKAFILMKCKKEVKIKSLKPLEVLISSQLTLEEIKMFFIFFNLMIDINIIDMSTKLKLCYKK